jgi:hypothetical protein
MKLLKKITVVLLCIAAVLFIVGYSLYYIFLRPEVIFQRISGLSLPSTARIVKIVDVALGPFGVDSTRCIQVSIDAKDMDEWLNQSPLKGKAEWKNGPVTYRATNEKGGIPTEVLLSPDIHYAMDTDKTFHRGRLLLLDPKANRAYLFLW